MRPWVWEIPPPDREADATFASALGISVPLAAILRRRGFSESEAARDFLQPRLANLAHPFEIRDLEAGAERLRRALRDREHIVVYGDYDVDGMTGTVILLNFIRLAGGQVRPYIPNRLREGYSFNDEALDSILASDPKPGLVITVDHGISAHAGIARLANAGVDVIVTDHHTPPPQLPEGATALINPRRNDCSSTFKSLCGAAVAYKLAWGAAESFTGQRKVTPEFREFLLDSMGLVALATVTDVVPLIGENRVLCFHGLKALAVSKNPGIRALLSTSRLDGATLRAVHVGFRIGPRLNAAGRLGIAEVAIDLLTTSDSGEAKRLAQQLERANGQRRELEKSMMQRLSSLPAISERAPDEGICIGESGWHPGVIGIVAARLVDRFRVPACVVALDGNRSRASVRSVPGVDVSQVLRSLSPHLLSHGGHAQAAGASLAAEKFPAFAAGFREATTAALKAAPLPTLPVDVELPLAGIRPELVEELERLAPHGAGNPTALFATRGLTVAGKPKTMGQNQEHLAFHVRAGDKVFRVFAPQWGQRRNELPSGARIDLAYRLKFDSYRDPGSIELEAVAIQTDS